MNWQIDGVDNNDFWHNIPAVESGRCLGYRGRHHVHRRHRRVFAQPNRQPRLGERWRHGETWCLSLAPINACTRTTTMGMNFTPRDTFFPAQRPRPQSSCTAESELRISAWGAPFSRIRLSFLSALKTQLCDRPVGVGHRTFVCLANPSFGYADGRRNHAQPAFKTFLAIRPPTHRHSGHRSLRLFRGPDNFFSPIASTGYSYNGVAKLDYNFTKASPLSTLVWRIQPDRTAGHQHGAGNGQFQPAFYFEKAPAIRTVSDEYQLPSSPSRPG